MTTDDELQWLNAYNGPFDIPPDSLTAKRMFEAGVAVTLEWAGAEDSRPVRPAADFHDRTLAPADKPANLCITAKPAIAGLLVTAGEKWA